MNDNFPEKFNKLESGIIIPYLKGEIPSLISACCLYHMIEQNEDIYTYLINGDIVIILEASRIDGSIIEDSVMSVKEYAKMKKGKQYHHYLRELVELSKRSDFQV